MRTVVLDPPPVEVEAWLARRRELGQDLFDEVWEGEYHVVPGPGPAHGRLDHTLSRVLGPLADDAGLIGHGPINIGVQDDYRVPDQAYLRHETTELYVPTAALVVEIVSPRDETWGKLDFYFARGVEELLIVDPQQRRVTWLRRGATGFEQTDRSALLDLTAADLAGRLDWPPSPRDA